MTDAIPISPTSELKVPHFLGRMYPEDDCSPTRFMAAGLDFSVFLETCGKGQIASLCITNQSWTLAGMRWVN